MVCPNNSQLIVDVVVRLKKQDDRTPGCHQDHRQVALPHQTGGLSQEWGIPTNITTTSPFSIFKMATSLSTCYRVQGLRNSNRRQLLFCSYSYLLYIYDATFCSFINKKNLPYCFLCSLHGLFLVEIITIRTILKRKLYSKSFKKFISYFLLIATYDSFPREGIFYLCWENMKYFILYVYF
jgi:hypothetical protein